MEKGAAEDDIDSITDSMGVSLRKVRDSERQRSLASYSPWGHKASDMT